MNLNGWKNRYLKEASLDFDMMMAFDWAARQYYYVDGDSDLYDQEFYINAKNAFHFEGEKCISKDKDGKLPYGYHGMLIKDAAYMVYQQAFSELLHDLAEILFIDEFYFNDCDAGEIEEALWEFLEAYKTLRYENLFEEAVRKNTQKK